MTASAAWEEEKGTSGKERISLLSAAGIVPEFYTGKALPTAGRGEPAPKERPKPNVGGDGEGGPGGFAAFQRCRSRSPGRTAQPSPALPAPQEILAPVAGSRGINKSSCQGGGNYEAVKESGRWM